MLAAAAQHGYGNLQTLWFGLIAVLWIGYFVLEGFDFGVGMLLRLVGRSEEERGSVLHTIAPVWDGNEVWLLVAGGATFAAFPEWYATLFSGFYLALFLILVGLIVRGVAIEYRGKHDAPRWRARWDWALVVSSAVPALLWGVGFGNILQGVPLDGDGKGIVPGIVPISALFLAFVVAALVRADHEGLAFVATAATIALVTLTIFLNLYPRVLVSSNGSDTSLTIWSTSSSHYTLTVMTVVALVFTPIVLLYQAWTYSVFRARVGGEEPKGPGELLAASPLGRK